MIHDSALHSSPRLKTFQMSNNRYVDKSTSFRLQKCKSNAGVETKSEQKLIFISADDSIHSNSCECLMLWLFLNWIIRCKFPFATAHRAIIPPSYEASRNRQETFPQCSCWTEIVFSSRYLCKLFLEYEISLKVCFVGKVQKPIIGGENFDIAKYGEGEKQKNINSSQYRCWCCGQENRRQHEFRSQRHLIWKCLKYLKAKVGRKLIKYS